LEPHVTTSEFATKTNEYLTDYVKFADGKAGAIVTFVTLLGGLVAAEAEPVLRSARTASIWTFVLGAAVAAVVLISVLMTLWNAISAVSPRTEGAEQSLHSFPHIAQVSTNSFVDAVARMSDDDVVRHISQHNAALARIAKAKFGAIARAIFWLRIVLFATFALALLYCAVRLVDCPREDPNGRKQPASCT
jgi:hypothetical protein